MKYSSAFASLVAVASLCVAFHFVTRGPATIATAATARCVECEQLNAQIAELRGKLAAVAAQSQPMPAANGAAGAPPSSEPATGADAVLDMRAAREADEARDRAFMASVEQSFRSERTELGWSSIASTKIGTAIEGDETLKALARNVECRSRTCRLELDDDGSGAVSRRMAAFSMSVADTLPSISAETIDAGNGHKTMVLYLSAPATTPSGSKLP